MITTGNNYNYNNCTIQHDSMIILCQFNYSINFLGSTSSLDLHPWVGPSRHGSPTKPMAKDARPVCPGDRRTPLGALIVWGRSDLCPGS